MYGDFRTLEFDFAARILKQLIIPELFHFKQGISTLPFIKINFDPNCISKIWQQNPNYLGLKPYTQNFRAIDIKMKENISLTNNVFHYMHPGAVIFSAKYFYYLDSNSHQTLIFE